jgi:hypothetical protein
MRWPWPYPARGDVKGVLCIVVLLCLIAFSVYWFANSKPNNNGFGGDWDCTPVPNGQPICIRKLGRMSAVRRAGATFRVTNRDALQGDVWQGADVS